MHLVAAFLLSIATTQYRCRGKRGDCFTPVDICHQSPALLVSMPSLLYRNSDKSIMPAIAS
jgi:hypothetical protein